MNFRDWMAAFAGRAGIDGRPDAERSARSIVYQLGGCLSWGLAQNVADELPEPLAGALRDGSFGTAMARFSAQAFVERLAERDRVGLEVARRRASAFLSLLREELPRSDVVLMDEELASWRTELVP
jgi:uncharacterized protein (DUF2267 family)